MMTCAGPAASAPLISSSATSFSSRHRRICGHGTRKDQFRVWDLGRDWNSRAELAWYRSSSPRSRQCSSTLRVQQETRKICSVARLTISPSSNPRPRLRTSSRSIPSQSPSPRHGTRAGSSFPAWFWSIAVPDVHTANCGSDVWRRSWSCCSSRLRHGTLPTDAAKVQLTGPRRAVHKEVGAHHPSNDFSKLRHALRPLSPCASPTLASSRRALGCWQIVLGAVSRSRSRSRQFTCRPPLHAVCASSNSSGAVGSDDDEVAAEPIADVNLKGGSFTPVDVLIVGGGIAGLATSLALHKVGIPSKVLEKAPGLRGEGASLGVWSNAWRALEVLGVAEDLRRHSLQVRKVEIWSKSARLIRTMDFQPFLELRGVLRNRLLNALASSLPPGTIRFNSAVSSIKQIPIADSATKPDTDLQAVEVSLEDGTKWRPKVLIGCEGIGSKVSSWLGLSRVRYAGYMGYRGVAEYPSGLISMGKGLVGTKEEQCCFQQFIGPGMRVGMYPLNANQLYWFVVYNSPEENVPLQDPTTRKAGLLELVNGWEGCGILDAVEHTKLEDISHSVIAGRYFPPLPSVRWGRGCVTLAGDAAHPMTPNLGQGGCMALEDSVVLARHLASSGAFSISNRTHLQGSLGGRENTNLNLSFSENNFSSDYQGNRSERIAAAIERYEKERIGRTTLITYKSWALGEIMQSTFPPLCFIRDEIVLPYLMTPKAFLRNTGYDCGELS